MSDLTEKLIPALQAGDMTAFPAVYEQMATRARGMMKAILAGRNPAQRMEESDLLNSVWMHIAANPAGTLASLTTSDELAGRLHRLLLQRWIQQCRRQTAQKRGGQNPTPFSQLHGENDCPLQIPDHRLAVQEFDSQIQAILECWPEGSHERQIVLLLLEGLTQQEIADRLNLSRHKVGRYIRGLITPVVVRFISGDESEGRAASP
ncbi:MAG: ECF-type sigma factor [Planctomycetaceae bacterium]